MSLVESDITKRRSEPTFVLLTGLAGSGKSKIVEIARDVIPDDYEIRELGDELLLQLIGMGVSITAKDEIKTLPASLVDKAIKGLLTRIVETASVNQLLVAHLVYPQGSDFVSLRRFYQDNVPVDAIIPVIGYPDAISIRQPQVGRNRVHQPPGLVNRQQLTLLSEALALGQATGAHFVPLMSRPEQNSLTVPIIRGTFNLLRRR